jgi:translation initiation factor 2 alpha subunit (eIF-2alpha)
MKVVVNKCYGGFSLSDKAVEMVMKRKGLECFRYKQTKYRYKDGVNEYIRCETFDDSDRFTHYLTEDLGEKTNKLPNGTYWNDRHLDRDDTDLVAVVEELGEEANGRFAKLKVIEIPDDIEWTIDEYDGVETIHEVHRSW